MTAEIPRVFHSIMPLGREFLVKRHDRTDQNTTIATQVFPSLEAAESYIIQQEEPKPVIRVSKKEPKTWAGWTNGAHN